jgi:hypothetical protein
MDKQNTTVTMSLIDFEILRGYQKQYEELVKEIKSLTYIDGTTTDSVTVAIRKAETIDFIAPYAARDMELDGYPNGVEVVWK